MYNVTQEFKDNILKFGRQIDMIISFDDIELTGKDMVSCTKEFEGRVYSTIMQYVNVELEGYHDLKDKTINVKLGVSYNGSTFSYVDYGKFIVDNDSIELIEETKSTKFSAYDLMVNTCKKFDSTKFNYPCSLYEFLSNICNVTSLELGTNSIPNGTLILNSDPFENMEVTYRDALDYTAQASGRNIFISNSKLVANGFNNTDVILDENNLSSLKIKKKWGPINSLVLAREPQEDNIYINDEESIENNGLNEIRFVNNLIIEPNRADFMPGIFEEIKGVGFYAFESKSFGYAYLEPCDVVSIVDLQGNEYSSIVLKNTLSITTGINERISFELPDITTTDYTKATKKEREEKNASLYVDKQLNKILANVNENNEKIAELELTSSSIKMSVSTLEKKSEIESSAGTHFSDDDTGTTTLTAHIYQADKEIDTDGKYIYTWYLVYVGGDEAILGNGKQITVSIQKMLNSKGVYFIATGTSQLLDSNGYLLTDNSGNILTT